MQEPLECLAEIDERGEAPRFTPGRQLNVDESIELDRLKDGRSDGRAGFESVLDRDRESDRVAGRSLELDIVEGQTAQLDREVLRAVVGKGAQGAADVEEDVRHRLDPNPRRAPKGCR